MMKLYVRYYIAFLVLILGLWIQLRAPVIFKIGRSTPWAFFLGITALYMFSHVLRMFRLALLTLDKRESIVPLVYAHVLTAFPSSFLPFKAGEVLRLISFFSVFRNKKKAFAVWAAERFGDVIVISAFILALRIFNVPMPSAMRLVSMAFIFVSIIGVAGLFSVAKVFVYLNRHLVLSSCSERGLKILRVSHVLHQVEIAIVQTLEGRMSAFLLFSLLIWFAEISALAMFVNHLPAMQDDFTNLFAAGLFASLPGGDGVSVFGSYQSLALVVVTIIFLLGMLASSRIKIKRK
jgi:hypothetical protein